jgi:CubicO group peptidase (beta-lactamase class C family)
MRKGIVLILLFVAFSKLEAQKIPNQNTLDTFINRALKEFKGVGVSVSIVTKNKVLLTKGYGFKDVATKKPVTENTLFAIGSSTKAFTASILGILSDTGMLDLEAPVRNYLPELIFYNDELNAKVTSIDLMTHRTGITRWDLSWYGSTTSRDSLLKRIKYFEPEYPFRHTWSYNNFMYLAQGVLGEKLTKQSWEKNIIQYIFDPLGMKASNSNLEGMLKSSDYSFGYKLDLKKNIKQLDFLNLDALGPAGSINSNAVDMAKWTMLWLNDGTLNGKKIFSKDYAILASTPQMNMGGRATNETPFVHSRGYGLGWFTSSYKGHYLVQHGGNIDGFSANVAFLPTDSIGIVVLSNQDGSVLPNLIRNFVIDQVLGLQKTDWIAKVKKQMPPAVNMEESLDSMQVKNTKPTLALEQYVGKYSLQSMGTVAISIKDSNLYAQYNAFKGKLNHYHYDVFVFEEENGRFDDQDPKFKFNMGYDGKIENIELAVVKGAKNEPLFFEKEIVSIAVNTNKLKVYEGTYDLMGTKAKIYLKGNTLYAFLEGQPEYELVPVAKDEFALKILKGYKLKFSNSDGVVDGKVATATFMQPEGNFVAYNDLVPKAAAKIIQLTSEEKQAIIGTYENGATVLKVYEKNGKLYFFIDGQPEYELVAASATSFVFAMSASFKLNFSKTTEGKMQLELEQPGGKLKATKK